MFLSNPDRIKGEKGENERKIGDRTIGFGLAISVSFFCPKCFCPTPTVSRAGRGKTTGKLGDRKLIRRGSVSGFGN
jgi:hypothetical protein